MARKRSKLSSKKHAKRKRPPAIDTKLTPSGVATSARTASAISDAFAVIQKAKRGRIHSAKSGQSARSKPADRRTERFGKRKADFDHQHKVASAGRDRSPGRQRGGGAKPGSKRARAAASGVSKSTIDRWDSKQAEGYFEQDPQFLLLDQRGGSNRRFSAFIEQLAYEFVVHRALQHTRTRPIDLQSAIVAFERAFPVERPKHATKTPNIKTVHSLIHRLDISEHTPSTISMSATRPSFRADANFVLENVNRFRPLCIWVYDECGIEWMPTGDETLAPVGWQVSVLGEAQSRGSTLFVGVNKHSRGRWKRQLRYFLLHHHSAKPSGKTREQHCPFFKLGLACDCSGPDGEPGMNINGLHASTLISIIKKLIADGQRSDEDGGLNGLRPGDVWLGDLLPIHHDPELMRLYSLAHIWALFFLAKTPIMISPLDNAGFAVLKGHVRSELRAVYNNNGTVKEADVERVVAEGFDLMLRSMDSMLRHCNITGNADAPVRFPPPVQTTQLPFGHPPRHSKPPSRGLGKRKQQPKAPTKRAKRRARARAAGKRLQSVTGDWLVLSPVLAPNTYAALILAAARACDTQLQNVARKVRSGEPKSKRAAKREQAAAAEMRRRVASQQPITLEDQLQAIADASGRRMALYTSMPDSALLSRPRIVDPQPKPRPVQPVSERKESLAAALAAPIAVRSKRKQNRPAAVAEQKESLSFEFDAQDAAPIRVLVCKPNKAGVSVFLLDLGHRGHKPDAQPQSPVSPKPRARRPKASSGAGSAGPVPVADDFSLLPAQRDRGPAAIGTFNPGNFCYANSLLVALAHARTFIERLCQAALPPPSADVARATVRSLRLLATEQSAVELGSFYAAALLGAHRLRDAFAQQEQEDATEFSTALMQRLSESSVGNIVRELFGLQLKQIIKCTGCPRRIEQPLTVLSLEVAIRVAELPQEYRTVVPVSHLIDRHFQSEYVESLCHGAINALRRHYSVVSECSPFLLLSIKRFRYSDLLNQATKLNFRVRINESVPVQKARYKVLAVVMHHGASAHEGHYTTLAQNTSSREWHVYDNDRQPRKVDFASFTATERFQRDAYVLLLSLESGGDGGAVDSDED